MGWLGFARRSVSPCAHTILPSSSLGTIHPLFTSADWAACYSQLVLTLELHLRSLHKPHFSGFINIGEPMSCWWLLQLCSFERVQWLRETWCAKCVHVSARELVENWSRPKRIKALHSCHVEMKMFSVICLPPLTMLYMFNLPHHTVSSREQEPLVKLPLEPHKFFTLYLPQMFSIIGI